jgi:hypothetical protein
VAQMDNRISLINKLKSRLTDYVSQGNQKETDLNDDNSLHNIPSVNFSSLRAHMLVENVKSGIILDNIYFNNSGVFSEYTDDGVFRFHIYPKISERDEMVENLDEKKPIIKHVKLDSHVK